ncbi:hypothetical protein Ctob_007492 [Chrysochromulina tobinii]|uniref:Uncharacterized protein n=1 Tax=Chrysochromulina tobinii TaxID=1460289 RepID=A0A0M0JEG3_9EUKA|nr:hypothetical protein Ctob_007492 [Chrysochromulina tobinii]|eukprot:KOO24633.1 hypothetical protein Ctob_007492 [Chrysochromulina sp. CCMP291]
MPQKSDRRSAGTKRAAITCNEGTAAASPMPMRMRAARSAGKLVAAAMGVAAWAADQTKSPAKSTTFGEYWDDAIPAGARPKQ